MLTRYLKQGELAIKVLQLNDILFGTSISKFQHKMLMVAYAMLVLSQRMWYWFLQYLA